MDNARARAILSAYRTGEAETDEPRFQEALAATEADPALAQWWEEQQDFDRVIAAKLQDTEVPRQLKAQIMARKQRNARQADSLVRNSWKRGVLLAAAAAIVALAVVFSTWRGAYQPATSLADYRDEMVSFVRLDPPLDVKSSDVSRLTAFLKEQGAPAEINLPPKLRQLEAAGCRRLRFRGEEVALICFKRGDGQLVHLFAIDKKAFAKLGRNRSDPEFAAEQNWSTASWTEGDHVYLLVTQGSRELLQEYVGTT